MLNKFVPCRLRFSIVQEHQQGDNLSTVPEKGTNEQLGYMTFSSEHRHHHTLLEIQTLCTHITNQGVKYGTDQPI